mmetsp:Transcript_50348/g.68866  ORF Transcript_50348/g.68866 Transcript_50348/m.68866 type:complete len:261 (+) Transcript_50348:1192-1974(+)
MPRAVLGRVLGSEEVALHADHLHVASLDLAQEVGVGHLVQRMHRLQVHREGHEHRGGGGGGPAQLALGRGLHGGSRTGGDLCEGLGDNGRAVANGGELGLGELLQTVDELGTDLLRVVDSLAGQARRLREATGRLLLGVLVAHRAGGFGALALNLARSGHHAGCSGCCTARGHGHASGGVSARRHTGGNYLSGPQGRLRTQCCIARGHEASRGAGEGEQACTTGHASENLGGLAGTGAPRRHLAVDRHVLVAGLRVGWVP